MGGSGRKTPLFSAPCTGLDWEGTTWAASCPVLAPQARSSVLPGHGWSLDGTSLVLEGSKSLSLEGKHHLSQVVIPRF